MAVHNDYNGDGSLHEERELEMILFRALQASGKLLPLTEKEVEIAESEENGFIIDLPQKLQCPPVGPSVIKYENNEEHTEGLADPAIGEALARAARNGKDISKEILDRMRQDRKQVEDQHND